MRIKIQLYIDEELTSQINWSADNELLKSDIKEIKESKQIPSSKIKEVLNNIINQKYKDNEK